MKLSSRGLKGHEMTSNQLTSPPPRRHGNSAGKTPTLVRTGKTPTLVRSFMIMAASTFAVLFFQTLLAFSFVFYEEGSGANVVGPHNALSDFTNRRAIEDKQTETPVVSPIPAFESESGEILFNPEEFRVGDKKKYINRPIHCPKCNKQVEEAVKREIPKPIGLDNEAQNRGNDVVVSFVTVTFMYKKHFGRLIESLRYSGYDGHIILGVHQDIPEASMTYLKENNVTVYKAESGPCQKPTSNVKLPKKQLKCYKSLETFPVEWGRYELARQWINACQSCTGRVLLALDGTDTIFQSNPFDFMEGRKEDILFTEEMAAHTNPFYYDPNKENVRHARLDVGRFKKIIDVFYGPSTADSLGPKNRPLLVPSTVIGSRNGILRYLSIMVAELNKHVAASGKSGYPKSNDAGVMNFLYYSGAFGFPETISTLPWGTGVFQNLGKPCVNLFVEKGKNPNSQLDIVKFDFNRTGYVVNRYESVEGGSRVAPVIHRFQPYCDKWIKAFISLHGELIGEPLYKKPDDYLEILKHTIESSVVERGQIEGSEEKNPMKTSYQRSTVVQQAPWFPAEVKCKNTCCAQAIAILLEPDENHLITSADGLDLADVSVLGHKRKDYLQFSISSLNFDIIPCLQNGAIIYADHEGGGAKRFFDIYRPNMTKPYLLVTGGSDGVEPLSPKGQGRKVLLTDDLLIRWYGINPSYKYGAEIHKFKMMHLGLSAMFEHQKFLAVRLKKTGHGNPFAGEKKKRWINSIDLATAHDTSRLLFVKFGINKHSQHRQLVWDMACLNRTGIPLDEISCSKGLKKFHNTEIYDSAEKYLFGLSPPGNGVDCYRTYELYFLGVIPVVKYRPEHSVLFRGLPLLEINEWNLTQEELVKRMRDYIASPKFLNDNFDGWERLFLKYWRTNVLNETGRLHDIFEDDIGRKYFKSWTYTRYTPPYEEPFWPPKIPLEKIKDML